MSFGMIDRHRPVVAGDIPVELVMIFEIADTVANDVVDFYRARGIYSVGDENFQIAVAAGSFGFVFQLLTGAVGDRGDIQKQRVVRASRPRIFDWDGAVNAVPWPIKTSLMRSFTSVEPSALMEIMSLKSAIRQLCAKQGSAGESTPRTSKKRGKARFSAVIRFRERLVLAAGFMNMGMQSQYLSG